MLLQKMIHFFVGGSPEVKTLMFLHALAVVMQVKLVHGKLANDLKPFAPRA